MLLSMLLLSAANELQQQQQCAMHDCQSAWRALSASEQSAGEQGGSSTVECANVTLHWPTRQVYAELQCQVPRCTCSVCWQSVRVCKHMLQLASAYIRARRKCQTRALLRESRAQGSKSRTRADRCSVLLRSAGMCLLAHAPIMRLAA